MKLKSILLLAVCVIALVFFIIPTFAPTVTAKGLLRDGQVATGDALTLLNQSELSLAMYDNALASNASDTAVLKKKGEALIKCGRIREAEQVYHEVLFQDRNDTTALVRMGDSLCEQGNFTGGISYYETAIALNPGDAKVWMREGDAYLMTSIEEGQGLHDAAKSLSRQPGTSGYQPISAEQLESMNSYKKAMGCYQKAMEIDPKLSVIVSTRVMGATQSQVSGYQTLLDDVRTSS